MRVLVAEDDAKLRDVLERGLRSAGYTVDIAARGDEALDLILLHQYVAAVVDWRMPVMDGIDVVTAIRARNLATPVLMLTARDTPSDRIRGLDAGCDDYLV
ncbi:MAG: response regulator, partial [Candidatus Dormiibacterota bacterium]